MLNSSRDENGGAYRIGEGARSADCDTPDLMYEREGGWEKYCLHVRSAKIIDEVGRKHE